MAPLPELTEAQRKSLTGKQKEARRKAEKQRSQSDERRVVEQIKRWFWYRQGKISTKNTFDSYIARMKRCPKPPRKLLLAQFLQHHPDHKPAVVALSEETIYLDRLPMRAKAAKIYVEGLPAERVLELEAERDDQYRLALETWHTSDLDGDGKVPDLDAQEQQRCRENFLQIFQPLLDAVSRYTGIMCSMPDGCPKLDKYDLPKFTEFASHFLGWLQTVERVKLGLVNPAEVVLWATPPPTKLSTEGLVVFDDEGTEREARRKAPKKRRNRRQMEKAKAMEEEEDSDAEDGVLDFDEMDCGAAKEKDDGDDEEDDKEGDDDKEDDDEEGDDGSEQISTKKKLGFQLEYNQYELDRMAHIKEVKKRLDAVGVQQAVTNLFQGKASGSKAASSDKDDAPSPAPKSQPPRPQPRRVTRSLTKTPSPNAEDPVVHPPLASSAPPTAAAPAAVSMPVPAPTNVPCTSTAGEDMNVDPTRPALSTIPSPLEPSAETPRELLLRAYSSFNVDYDPAIDRVEPRGYTGCELARTMGEFLFLFNVPKSRIDSYESRSMLYKAVVSKWMEVEAVLMKLEVDNVKSTTPDRPDGFKAWFKNGRVGSWLEKSGSLDTPVMADLQEFRSLWWKWFDNNMPDWRPRVDSKLVLGGDGDWEDCKMPGKDGMVLFVVGLKWWYVLAGGEDKEGDWEQAAKLVYYTLD
ncbi:hypothetical protein V5O48_008137 [Marasmius crinis-equi]|uniref:Uncharacterized protein n=1 Tax=Marasmius crinis-equi TaxID=585013 RepID=A0ABR3FEN8_9AGAR